MINPSGWELKTANSELLWALRWPTQNVKGDRHRAEGKGWQTKLKIFQFPPGQLYDVYSEQEMANGIKNVNNSMVIITCRWMFYESLFFGHPLEFYWSNLKCSNILLSCGSEQAFRFKHVLWHNFPLPNKTTVTLHWLEMLENPNNLKWYFIIYLFYVSWMWYSWYKILVLFKCYNVNSPRLCPSLNGQNKKDFRTKERDLQPPGPRQFLRLIPTFYILVPPLMSS